MQYRSLGQSGLKVSPVCLGTMMFGRETAPAQARKIIDHARGPASTSSTRGSVCERPFEEIVGSAIKAQRYDWVLATKVGNPMGDGPGRRGLSRRWILRAAEESLTRSRPTGSISTICISRITRRRWKKRFGHRRPDRSGQDTTFRGIELPLLADRRDCSAVRPCRCAETGGEPTLLQCLQPSARSRATAGLRPPWARCRALQPAGRGVLTGKYASSGKPAAGSRAGRGDARMLESEWRPESLVLAQQVAERAQALGVTGVDLAVGWVLNNRLVSAVLAGPRTLEQWRSYLRALAYRFTAEDEAFFDSLVAAGHPSTPGYNDPRYPIEGRLTHTEPVAAD